MLSKAEREYLAGQSDISSDYARILRSRINKKVNEAVNDFRLIVTSRKIRMGKYKDDFKHILETEDDNVDVSHTESAEVQKRRDERDKEMLDKLMQVGEIKIIEPKPQDGEPNVSGN